MKGSSVLLALGLVLLISGVGLLGYVAANGLQLVNVYSMRQGHDDFASVTSVSNGGTVPLNSSQFYLYTGFYNYLVFVDVWRDCTVTYTNSGLNDSASAHISEMSFNMWNTPNRNYVYTEIDLDPSIIYGWTVNFNSTMKVAQWKNTGVVTITAWNWTNNTPRSLSTFSFRFLFPSNATASATPPSTSTPITNPDSKSTPAEVSHLGDQMPAPNGATLPVDRSVTSNATVLLSNAVSNSGWYVASAVLLVVGAVFTVAGYHARKRHL